MQNSGKAAVSCFVQIRGISVWERSGVGPGLVWGRPHVDCTKL